MNSCVDRVFLAIDRFNRALRWFGVVCVLVLTIVVVREVFMRYVFNRPSGITVELARTLQLYFGFLCAGYVQSIKAHLNMGSLLEYLRPKARTAILIIGSLVGAIFCGIMAYYSCLMVMASIQARQTTALLEWPMSIVKAPALIGFILLGIQFIVDAWKYYRNIENESEMDMSSWIK